jgi:hypothetical protein
VRRMVALSPEHSVHAVVTPRPEWFVQILAWEAFMAKATGTTANREVPAEAADQPSVDTEIASGGSGPDTSVAGHVYRRFQERGAEHGHDIEDWLEAEREFRDESGE